MTRSSGRPADGEPTRGVRGVHGAVANADPRVSETAELSERTIDLPAARGAPASPAVLRPGDVFAGRYEVLSCIGQGGFSLVFKTRDRSTGETVALKFLAARDTGKDVVERMHRELRLARDLRHPSIVRVNELLEAEGFYCLSMEFVEGTTLKELIRDRRPLPVHQAVGLLLRLASALAAVHAAGIVHRDLKPQNVIATPDGNVKLLDFGLARTPDSTGLTASGTILGTPEYMSPEQVEGRTAQAASDLYSLGIIGYELFAGEPPYHGDTPLATALQHIRTRVPDVRKARPETPETLARLLLRMTEPQPSRRPGSAQEVLVELTRLSERGASAPAGARRLKVAAALLGVAVAAGAGVLVLATRRAVTAPGADPFRDGMVDVAVAPAGAPDVLGGGPFLAALTDAVSVKLGGPRTKVHPLRPEEARGAAARPEALGATGVEQLLLLGVEREQGEDRFRVDVTVRNTRDGSLFRPLSPRLFRTLDFEAVDGISQAVASEYLAAVDGAVRTAKGGATGR